jgi:hypothetical protein
MPFKGPNKSWQEMTRREIIQSLIAISIVFGAFAAFGIWKLASHQQAGAMIVFPIFFIIISVCAVGQSYVRGIRELRRRKRN